jgi:hypothetical protein
MPLEEKSIANMECVNKVCVYLSDVWRIWVKKLDVIWSPGVRNVEGA